MIRISDEELHRSIALLSIAEKCHLSHECLWCKKDRLSYVFQESKFCSCRKNDCPIVVFRKKLESESLLFYNASASVSRVKSILENALKILETKQGSARKRLRRYVRKLEEIKTFDHLFILAIYPLSLKTEKIPSFKYEEIAGLAAVYNSNAETKRRILMEISDINSTWSSWIHKAILHRIPDNNYYETSIFYLTYVFIKGLEKNELPDIEQMSAADKNKFFDEIKIEISPAKKLMRILKTILSKKTKTD